MSITYDETLDQLGFLRPKEEKEDLPFTEDTAIDFKDYQANPRKDGARSRWLSSAITVMRPIKLEPELLIPTSGGGSIHVWDLITETVARSVGPLTAQVADSLGLEVVDDTETVARSVGPLTAQVADSLGLEVVDDDDDQEYARLISEYWEQLHQ